MFVRRWRSLAPGGMQGIRSGHETLARWRLDAPTPMERMRILDPAIDKRTIRITHLRALRLSAGFKEHSRSLPPGQAISTCTLMECRGSAK